MCEGVENRGIGKAISRRQGMGRCVQVSPERWRYAGEDRGVDSHTMRSEVERGESGENNGHDWRNRTCNGADIRTDDAADAAAADCAVNTAPFQLDEISASQGQRDHCAR
jgi:hypothetical protein